MANQDRVPKNQGHRTRRIESNGQVLLTPEGERPRREEYVDLSLGGMFVKSLFPEPPNTRMKIDLELMGLRMRAPGKVVWVRPRSYGERRPSGMGIAFEALSEAQRKLIYKQIAQDLQSGSGLKSGQASDRRASKAVKKSGGIAAFFRRKS